MLNRLKCMSTHELTHLDLHTYMYYCISCIIFPQLDIQFIALFTGLPHQNFTSEYGGIV